MQNFLMDPHKNEIDQLKADLKRRFIKFNDQSNFSKWRYYLSNKQYKTLLFYRLSRSLRPGFLKWVFWHLYLDSSQKSGLEILTQKLGGGVILPHWGRILLNAEEIGANLYCFHNVTVGNDYKSGKPKIGKNVFIGTGSVILGKITIGDNVVIGASSFVNSDVPSNSLVAGNPAKIIKSIDDTYIEEMIGY